MFRKRKCEPDWELIDILKHDIDYQNTELWKAAAEIENLRNQIRALEAERDQWQRQALGG